MADFGPFLPILLKFEGGFVDDPDDPGGATNKGITMKTFNSCAQKLLGVQPTLANLKAISDDQAGIIYKALYWDKVRGDDLTSQQLANIVCDFYVNSGANATKLLQRTINSLGGIVEVDGGIGKDTLKALAKLDQIVVYREYKLGRITFYQDLVKKNPNLKKFLKGWLNRVNAFPDL